MPNKNRYSHRARINENVLRRLIRLYADGLDASSIAIMLGLNRNTVNRYLHELRQRLPFCLQRFRTSRGLRGGRVVGIELSSIGLGYVSKFKKTKNSRSDSLLLGVQKQGEDFAVWTIDQDYYSSQKLRGIIRGAIPRQHILDWGGFSKFDVLIDAGQQLAYPIDQILNIQLIEEFWSFTKARLAMYRGVKSELMELYLNECLFRFNHRNENIYSLLMLQLKQQPLFSKSQQKPTYPGV